MRYGGAAPDAAAPLAMQVIKVGTSSLLRDDKHSLNLSSLAGICETVRELKDQGGLAPGLPR